MSDYTLADYANIRNYLAIVEYSPDGTQIAHVTNESGQYNLWLIPSGGGERRQLTFYTDNTVRAMHWSPDGRTIAFTADANGDEQMQMYLLDVETGAISPLRHTARRQHHLGRYSPDGKWLAYTANDRAEQDMDLQLINPATGEHRRITEGRLMFGATFSPDGRYLSLMEMFSNTHTELYVYDLQDDALIHVPVGTEENAQAAEWSADSRTLYFTTNAGREFTGLAECDVATWRWRFIETPDWDVELCRTLHQRGLLMWTLNEDGASTLHARDLATGQPVAAPTLPYGVLTNFVPNPDNTRLALTFSRPVEASNLYEIDLATGTLTALGTSMLAGIPEDRFVMPQLVRYPTFDGRDIPAWLFVPKVGDGPYPVIVSIHGGPEAQEQPNYAYSGFYQYMLNRGFAILAPNIRGSTGYGIAYQKLIHRDWGGDELKDIEHAALYLRGLDFIDSSRIAIFGGSFGGFATLSAVTRLPEYWAAGVDLVGPSNLVSFVQSVPEYWKRIMKQWVGDAVEDAEMLMARSPITYVDNLRAPLLVVQGANDPRVVKAESDQMVERIRANGGDVTYYVDETEGHGTTRRETTVRWFSMIADFLTDTLLDEAAPQG